MDRANTHEDSRRKLRLVAGVGLKAVRERLGLRQEDLAETARFAGLPWTRATVASVEVGRRGLGLEELLLLSMALQCQLADFFEGGDTEWVQITPDASATLAEIRGRLRGGGHDQSEDHWDVPGYRSQGRLKALVRMLKVEPCELLWPQAPGPDALAVIEASEGEAEQHLARTLGVDPLAVTLAAFGQWGRGLSAERDRLIAERSPRGSLQTTRGHVTRSLVGQIAPQITRFAEESEARSQQATEAHARISAAMDPKYPTKKTTTKKKGD